VKIVLFILAPLFIFLTPRYDDIFSEGYHDALNYIYENGRVFNALLDDSGDEQDLVVSIIFPELMRHSFLMDYFQERAMEIVYINHGKEQADFSIGRLQMKPSFIEDLEEYVQETPSLKNDFEYLTRYASNEVKAVRKERIDRMKSLHWQLHYMKAFVAAMDYRFRYARWRSFKEKISIYSTAYNHNFLADYTELKVWSEKCTFPYGMDSDQKQYSYALIAVYFYERDWPALEEKIDDEQ
jgi:hypothetical protein